MSSTTLTASEEVVDALRGEAARRLTRVRDVLDDFVRCCWPEYVAHRLRRDLDHPIAAQLIDAYAEMTSAEGKWQCS
jgi:hypothetical protein